MLFCRLANANEWFDEFERRGSRRLPFIDAFQVALRKTWNSGRGCNTPLPGWIERCLPGCAFVVGDKTNKGSTCLVCSLKKCAEKVRREY